VLAQVGSWWVASRRFVRLQDLGSRVHEQSSKVLSLMNPCLPLPLTTLGRLLFSLSYNFSHISNLFIMGKTKIPMEDLPWETKLRVTRYNKDDCNAAIHGQKIPGALGLRVHRHCVIRGIRHHDGFAHELRGIAPEFTRALKRSCNHPRGGPRHQKPLRDTLLHLASRRSALGDPARIGEALSKYDLSRGSCLCRGRIFDIYLELQVLSEVYVAAEARDASLARENKGSEAIFENIMSNHVKFETVNDYDRFVNIKMPRPASLNRDAEDLLNVVDHIKWHREDCNTYRHFKITEDVGIDDHNRGAPAPLASFWPRLYSPLPMDLPPINKDNLNSSAAYLGDVGRYTPL